MLEDFTDVLDIFFDDLLEEGHEVQQLRILEVPLPRFDCDRVHGVVGVALRIRQQGFGFMD